jgi:hypothetical protein
MWDKMLQHWDDWSHPMRPNKEDVRIFSGFTRGREKRLLLGSTPELLPLVTDHADKLTNGYDWFNLPYPEESFDLIIGDLVLLLTGPTLVDTMRPFLKPNGKLVLRVLLSNLSNKPAENFLVEKFRGLEGFVPVQQIYDKHGDTPTTRDYNGSPDIYYFPHLTDLEDVKSTINPGYMYNNLFKFCIWTA